MITKFDELEFIDGLASEITEFMEAAQYKAISVITKRIESIGRLTVEDASRLSQLARMRDLDRIKKEIAKETKRSLEKVDEIVEKAAKKNDSLAAALYAYRNLNQSNFMENSYLSSFVESAKKQIRNNIVNLSDTRAMNLVVGGKPVSIEKAYNMAVNRGIFEVQQGLFDYRTSTRSIVSELAANGLGVIEYESGYRRRLDSAVNMNVQDGIRQMNMAYREQQGAEFGGDHVFISFHLLPADDHAFLNGMDYTLEEWNRISSTLARPIGTLNCRHSISYGITGISENPISDKDRANAIKNANKKVEYSTLQKDADGNIIKKQSTLYEATQKQRQIETDIRRMKDVQNQLKLNNDSIGVAAMQNKIDAKTSYYKTVSNQIGLSPKMDRLKVYSE